MKNSEIVKRLKVLFPTADFQRDVLLVSRKGVLEIKKTPRPLLPGELEAVSLEKNDSEKWREFLAGTITAGGLALKASVSARDAFAGQVTLLREGLDLQQITPESSVSIWDANNVEHVLTVNQCRAVLFEYGLKWAAAFSALAP